IDSVGFARLSVGRRSTALQRGLYRGGGGNQVTGLREPGGLAHEMLELRVHSGALWQGLSANALTQGGFDRWAGMKRAQNRQGLDGGKRQFRRDIWSDRREPDHFNLQHLALGLHRQQVLTGVVLNAQDKRLSADGLSHDFAVQGQLVANRSSDQVRAVRIKTFLNQQVDLT